jgi:glutathione S-transferase
MQIGSDIYCDSQLIVRELERRHPTPTLFPAGDRGLGAALALWTDRALFQCTVVLVFGGLGDKVPPAFVADREALSGRPFDPAAMRAAVPHMAAQMKAQAALLGEQLADGRPFLTGGRPGLADAGAYYNLWFLRNAYRPAAAWIDDDRPLADWLDRVRAIGHGRRSDGTAEAAIEAAQTSAPEPGQIDPGDALAAFEGREVTVAADDYGRDPVRGELVAASRHHVAIRRRDPRAGEVVVHFPRIGFSVQG